MKSSRRLLVLLESVALAVLLAGGVALALPSELPDNTPMLNGPVRAFAQVGTNVWVGGNFTQVQRRDGSVIANVSNVAVFDKDGNYLNGITPRLGAGSTTTNVRDMAVYGNTVVIAGDFPGPTSTQKNLVAFDGTTGGLVKWFANAPKLQSVLAAPGLGRVYGGGVSLSAFDFATGKMIWSSPRAKTTVDPSIRSHKLGAGYRDLELDADGSTIWAACGCDAIVAPDGTSNPAKALVRLNTEGAHDPSWVAEAGVGAFGISVVDHQGALYLGAGGSDYLARYSKATARFDWRRDTSGSAQVVEVLDGGLVVGGHFVEVADQASDQCGFRSSNPDTLDPNEQCQRRDGLAAYSFTGTLDPNWDTALTGKYNLAWALLPEATTAGTRLYVGGEYTHVNRVKQEYYARLSPALLP